MSGLRQKSLDNASKWTELMLRMCDDLAQSINDAWKVEELNDMMLGFSTRESSGKSDQTSSVEALKTGIKGIKQLLDESGEIESMLEAQTTSSRMVVTQTVEQLEAAQAELAAIQKEAVERNSKIVHLTDANREQSESIQELSEKVESLQSELTESNTSLRQLRAANVVNLGALRQSETELAQVAKSQSSEVEAVREEMRSSIESAVADERKSWQTKYSALEADFAVIEPRYKVIVEQQRGRIRLLERELSEFRATSDAKKMAAEEIRNLASELANEREKQRNVEHELAECKAALAETKAQFSEVSHELKDAASNRKSQTLKIDEVEKGLIEAICERKKAQDALELKMAEVADMKQRILEQGMRAAEHSASHKKLLDYICNLAGFHSVTLDRTSVGTDLGLQVSETPSGNGAQISEVKPGSTADQTDNLNPGDFVVAINGRAMLEQPLSTVIENIMSGGDSIELLLASADVADESDDEEEIDDPDEEAYESEEEEQEIPLAVLIDMRSARPGLQVKIQAALTHESAEFYFSAVERDGMTGIITMVYEENETCQIEFPESETCRVPVGALVFIPDGSIWDDWSKTRMSSPEKNSLYLAQQDTHAVVEDENFPDPNGNLELEPELVKKIVAAVHTEDAGETVAKQLNFSFE